MKQGIEVNEGRYARRSVVREVREGRMKVWVEEWTGRGRVKRGSEGETEIDRVERKKYDAKEREGESCSFETFASLVVIVTDEYVSSIGYLPLDIQALGTKPRLLT